MANSKIVTYDLRVPGRDYNSLYDRIKSYPGYAYICESVVILPTQSTCEEIRDYLKAVMDSNDRLFVAELTGTAAWRNAMCGSEQLKKKL